MSESPQTLSNEINVSLTCFCVYEGIAIALRSATRAIVSQSKLPGTESEKPPSLPMNTRLTALGRAHRSLPEIRGSKHPLRGEDTEKQAARRLERTKRNRRSYQQI
jgi:hypothetical protein